MKIGFPGNMFEIPAPSAGMGFSNNSDTETLELDTGGRYVADTPTTYKSFNMSWRSNTDKLQPLIDIYNKRYGTRPFYIQDMHGGEGNILPARWAYPAQLVAIHGATGGAALQDDLGAYFRNVKFRANQPTLKVPTFEGKPLYLAVFPHPTVTTYTHNPMGYRKFDIRTGEWSSWASVPYTKIGSAPTTILTRADSQYIQFIELRVNLGGTIYITGADLSTSDYRSWDNPRRSAVGVGACKFTNVLDGDLTMLKAKRVGLSADITEVQYG